MARLVARGRKNSVLNWYFRSEYIEDFLGGEDCGMIFVTPITYDENTISL